MTNPSVTYLIIQYKTAVNFSINFSDLYVDWTKITYKTLQLSFQNAIKLKFCPLSFRIANLN